MGIEQFVEYYTQLAEVGFTLGENKWKPMKTNGNLGDIETITCEMNYHV